MATKAATDRLKKEYRRLLSSPVELIEAAPEESDILTWHYVISGPSDSSYSGGYYHGKLMFPKQYPYKPPAIVMLTPNGRFKTNTHLCLSMSSYHPETWNPLWNVGSILTGILSFMLEITATYGSMDSSDEMKRIYAANSLAYNLKDHNFVKLFPHYKQVYADRDRKFTIPQSQPLPNGQASKSASSQTATTTTANNKSASSSSSNAVQSGSIDAQPLLANGAVRTDEQPATQRQPAADLQRGHAIDKAIILVVLCGIAFLLSYLYT